MKLIKQTETGALFELKDAEAFDVLYDMGKQAYLHSYKSPGFVALGKKHDFKLEDEVTKCVFPKNCSGWKGPLALDIDYMNGLMVKATVEEIAKHKTEPKKLYVFQTAKYDQAHYDGAGKELIQKMLGWYTSKA